MMSGWTPVVGLVVSFAGVTATAAGGGAAAGGAGGRRR